MADGESVVAQGNQLGDSGVTSERWKKVEALFEQTLEAPATERPDFLQAIDDAELRGEVESLLKAHQEAGAFLDEPDNFLSRDSFELDALSPGQIIDRYRIIREIGRGGMGAVFLAERADDEYKKQVALKLIKRGTDTDSVLRHFRNERQILAGFDHPNIGRLFDGGTTESGLPYFVMEYVEGLPIDDYCKTHALSVIDRLKLFREVCAAVSYAHRRLVIHRDIKPSNILVTAEGVAKLLDFGIAKLLHDDEGAQPTVTGVQLMTPQSASPEQLRGQPVTTATDVYSLGVVLYELLCGRSPYQFKSQSPNEMARVITETEPQKPSTAVARESRNSKFEIRNSKMLKGDLDNIVLMALRKEPERRYQSVEQFSEDVRRHLEQRPVLARKDTWGYRAAKFARRNKAGLAAAAIVLLILIGGILATSRESQIAKQEKTRAERRFNDVRKLANNVLFDYHDAIKALPGATKVRERLVKDALNYLDSLGSEAQGDPDLQRELAAAYDRVADVRGDLGDLAGAAESSTKAFRILEALVALKPDDVRARRNLAVIHAKIGRRLLDTGEANNGLQHLRTARTLCFDLAREQPASDDIQLEFASICNRLGNALTAQGDLVAALEEFRTALAICERLAAARPQDQSYRRTLWITLEGIANVRFSQKNTDDAIAANNKVLALGEALIKENPTNADYRRRLIKSYQNAGEYRKRTDKPRALEHFLRAIALEEELVAADPPNAVTRSDLGFLHKRIADFLANANDNTQALSHFSKAREIFEKLGSDAPEDVTSRFRAATCGAAIAGMQARLGEMDSALQECRKSVALLGEIREEATDTRHRSERAEAYEYLGYAFSALAESPKALPSGIRSYRETARDMFQEALKILEALRSRGALNPEDAHWAETIADEVAKCDAALAR